MNDHWISELRGFLRMLNEEGDAGRTCSRALLGLPSDAWEDAVAAHPEWVRVGTVRALLAGANDLAARDPALALAITTFVVTHIHDVPFPPYGTVLMAPLEGEAHTARANALLACGDPTAALDAISLAEGLLALVPIASIERADATLVRARILGALQHDDAALDLFDHCLRDYADHRHYSKYARALTARALHLCDMRQWAEAWHTLDHARDTAASVNYEQLSAELRAVIEQCHHMGLPNNGPVIATTNG